MRYLATVVYEDGSTTKLFAKKEDAEGWLDSENNNLEHTTTVTVYDDTTQDVWKITETYIYTQGE